MLISLEEVLGFILFTISCFVMLTLLESRERVLSLAIERMDILKETLESIGEGAIIADTRSRIVFANKSALSYIFKDLVGILGKHAESVFRLYDEKTHQRVVGPFRLINPHHESFVAGNFALLETVRGINLPVEYTSSIIRDEKDQVLGIIVLLRDLTGYRRTNFYEVFLSRISKILAEAEDEENALIAVATQSVPKFADWCVVDILEGEEELKRHYLAHQDMNKAVALKEEFPLLGLKKHHEIAMDSLKTGRSKFFPRINEENLKEVSIKDKEFEMLKTLNLRSAILVPLIYKGTRFGTLLFVTGESGRIFTLRDLTFAEDLASHVVVILHNLRLYKQAKDAIQARDEFLSIASHELKTPLTSILLQIERAIRDVSTRSLANLSRERLLSILSSTRRQTKRMASLINDLLNVSLITSGRLTVQPESMELSGLMNDVLMRFEEEAQKAGCIFQFDTKVILKGTWDRIRLEQVIANLISNAIKYGAGKPVTVTTSRENSYAVITVSDQGIGISESYKEVIFKAFVRAVNEKEYKGMGVGLYIANEIVKAHKGRIELISALNKGSTFRVFLPLESSF